MPARTEMEGRAATDVAARRMREIEAWLRFEVERMGESDLRNCLVLRGQIFICSPL